MVHASTPSPDRRQRRREARTQLLLDAARDVLLDQGEGGLTMAAVADRADVAVGGLYRYFEGKEALLAALQVRAVATFGGVLGGALAGHTEPLHRIRAAGQAWFTFADEHPEEFELLDRSLSDPRPNLDETQARAVDEALRPVLGRVAAELDAAVQARVLSPAPSDVRAHVLWAVVHGAAHFRKRDRLGGVTARQVLDQGLDALLRGWAG